MAINNIYAGGSEDTLGKNFFAGTYDDVTHAINITESYDYSDSNNQVRTLNVSADGAWLYFVQAQYLQRISISNLAGGIDTGWAASGYNLGLGVTINGYSIGSVVDPTTGYWIITHYLQGGTSAKKFIPMPVRKFVDSRIDPGKFVPIDHEEQQSFDLIRASVNLMVASMVISFATSLKLPLSTTYVTFMVAMGTSFSDRAWDRETAVYRVTGVMTVVGGWFMTAVIAFSVAFVFANLIYFSNGIGVVFLIMLEGFIMYRTHKLHGKRYKEQEESKVFNLKKIKETTGSGETTFEHMGLLLREIRESLDITFNALFAQDVASLREQRKKSKKVQQWANIIIANIFKVLRLQQKEKKATTYKYAQTIRRIQKLADGHRDIVLRSYLHVSNHHKGLLDVQITELGKIKENILKILAEVEATFERRENFTPDILTEQLLELRSLANLYHNKQVERIQDESSTTRLSILYYAIIGNCIMLGKQNIKLLEIFEEGFVGNWQDKTIN